MKKYLDYLVKIGVNLNDNEHPLSIELDSILILKNTKLSQCAEFILMILIRDLTILEGYDKKIYLSYINSLNKKDMSFWGIRFELFCNANLILNKHRLSINTRKGEDGTEADFIIERKGAIFSIETTSLNYNEESLKSNPASKIKKKVSEKELKQYSNLDCCLMIDITNLIFEEMTTTVNNNKLIENILSNFSSKFGAVLFHQSFHEESSDRNLHYKSVIYEWINPDADKILLEFLNDMKLIDENTYQKRYFLNRI